MITAPFPITTVPPGLISTEDTKKSYKINDLPTRLNGPERKTEYAEHGSMPRFLIKSCSSDENDDHMLQVFIYVVAYIRNLAVPLAALQYFQ